ncbi:nitrous oxide reductase accessory protein NosL [Desulfovibrio sp. TomC]|uniref:nitrous oxide reductase accessory protein NosL n=1 Tax=Desulfovibrio sp. TomC TaxID=1562888 RepID=UPI00057481A9|nr:nitrous oxide reductase accessory protein NosL [Desulfovibrio sp. TomC]KHK03944.1 hypothetical protein NY78_0386 [Desulfovibrio sp. TomC]
MRFRIVLTVVTLACCLLPGLALAQGNSPATPPAISQDVHDHASCPLCGMDRGKFAHSRMLIEYGDGTVFPACSLHCAVLDMAVNLDKTPTKSLVADYKTKELIDAEKAFWVIGGDQMGVMSKRAKWAFASKAEAEAFIKAHGGQLADFDAAIKAAFEDMASDTMMIREKRKMKAMQHPS